MLAGPKRAVSGPKRAAPVEPGHRGQLARLIRERPVFVNAAWRRSAVLRNGTIPVNISPLAVFSVRGWRRAIQPAGVLGHVVADPGKVGSVRHWPGTGRHDRTVI